MATFCPILIPDLLGITLASTSITSSAAPGRFAGKLGRVVIALRPAPAGTGKGASNNRSLFLIALMLSLNDFG